MGKIKKLQHHFEEEKTALFEAIRDFQNGDEDKATAIYKLSKQYSYSMIYQRVSKFMNQNILSGDTKAIVEDIMQELYMEFFRTISQFRNEDPNSFYKWILVVSNRMVLRYVDKNKMEVLKKEQSREYEDEYDDSVFSDIAEDEEQNPEFVPDVALEKKEFQRLMKDFIGELPEEQAETILYHIYGGMKYQEIADLMGVSLITVKTRMRKAKDSLREKISEYEKKTGTRLRVVAPLPLIGLYLRAFMKQSKLPMSTDFRLFNQIRTAIGQSVSAFSRYIEALIQMNGAKDAIVGIVVATVIGVGTIEVIRQNLPTSPTPMPSTTVEQQNENGDEEVDEEKQEETNQDSEDNLVANPDENVDEQTPENPTEKNYFVYWDNEMIDVSSYVYEGEEYEDPVYGRINKWLLCEDALLQLPFTRKTTNGNHVYCYDDGTNKYEFVFRGVNSYTINGASYTYDMEMEVIDGKKYINPYHLYNNMFGMTDFITGGGSGGDFIAIKTTQYNPPTVNNQNQTDVTTPSTDTIVGSNTNQISPPGGYKNGDAYASSRFQGIADFLKNEKGGDSLVVEGTSLNYFDSIYVSYDNADGSWMYLRLAKWTTNAKLTNSLEDQVYGSLGSTLYVVMQIIHGAGGDYGMQLYQKVVNLLGEYYYPQNIPTQGMVEEDVPGFSVTLTQSPDGLEIRYYIE